MHRIQFDMLFENNLGRGLLHLLFWMAAAGFLVYFFGHFTEDYRYTSLFVSLLMPIVVGTSYTLNYFLIPRYLLYKRYARFAWYFVFLLIVSMWGIMLVVIWAYTTLADYQYSNMPPLTTNIFYLVVGLYFLVLFSALVKLLKYWYKGQQHIAELHSKQLEAELKLREAELQLLKGQIHPHFLFNTLNNIYGLALEQSSLLPDAIIRLSGLLDALLYRSHKAVVPLSAELKLIEDYVSLEKLRFEDRLVLEWQVPDNNLPYEIAPFLLFPFLENAFKHGFSENTEQLYLQVHIGLKHEQLCVKVVNSIATAVHGRPSLPGGIGLKNVRKRLELLYPGKHTLQFNTTENALYQVELTLTLQPNHSLTYANEPC